MQEIKKNIKIEYGRDRYQNISDENKQRLKKTKEIILNKKKHIFFFFTWYKNAFRKNKRPITIDEVDIKRIVLYKKFYLVKKVHLNILLDI